MRRLSITVFALFLATAFPVFASVTETDTGAISSSSRDFVPPASTDAAIQALAPVKAAAAGNQKVAAIWPFNGGNKEKTSAKPTTPRSPRKAFFLSMLLPGLGEYYAGSNRSVIFLGVEAAGWWTYVHYTNKGNDLETDYKNYADANWQYNGDGYNYVTWLAGQLKKNGLSSTSLPLNYADLAKNPAYMDSITKALTDMNDTWVTHSLPSTKTQQYYEMIGKYPQFVYGWKDITQYNTTLADSSNYDENIREIKSAMRTKYMSMRHDSNSNLKMGMNGVSLLIVNRVISAIDAARIAYHRNKSMESELSMVRVNLVQKYILDHEVSMLTVSKKF